MEDHVRDAQVRLPPGRQFALTWSVPDNFGGMTSAMLHRSRAFVRLGGAQVDILTFDARPDYPAVEAALRESGELIDGIRLLNLWDWFRDHGIAGSPGSLDLGRHPFNPLDHEPEFRSAWRGARELTRTRFAPDGLTALQADYFREDGSLLASDRRDVAVEGELGGRSVVLCDEDGQPLRSWGKVWDLYRYWVDLVRSGQPSYLIVDSKTVARFAMTYKRKRAVVIHVVHNSHLAGDQRPIAPLRESRRLVFERLAEFDSVVLLTSRQRRDVEALLGAAGNLAVIPNSRRIDASRSPELLERSAGRGVVLASLTRRKRVDHAARAAIDAARLTSGLVTLDIYGDGEERGRIQSLIDKHGSGHSIRLHGHQPNARERLADASFVVLTGRTEGFPLVLVESMAEGCIPIAYDVPYGPADIIVHGENGFLIAPGDVAGITRAIVDLQAMSTQHLAQLRMNARRSADGYSDAAITRLWATEMRIAAARKATSAWWVRR